MVQMERDVELNEVQKQHLEHKLQEQAVEIAQLDVEALIYESNQKRMRRAKQRMEYLTRFAEVISETMTVSEIFWSLMQLDMERMKNRTNYDSKLDAYRMDSLGCNRRIVSLFSNSFFARSKVDFPCGASNIHGDLFTIKRIYHLFIVNYAIPGNRYFEIVFAFFCTVIFGVLLSGDLVAYHSI